MPAMFLYRDYRRPEGPYDAGGVVANSKLPSVAPLALANSHMDEAPLLAN
jgi:hypothetical protein